MSGHFLQKTSVRNFRTATVALKILHFQQFYIHLSQFKTVTATSTKYVKTSVPAHILPFPFGKCVVSVQA